MRRNGTDKVGILDSELEEYMQDTLGLMIYQEDVMRALRESVDIH